MKLKGIEELQRGLNEASRAGVQKRFRNAMEDSVNQVKSRARENAPSFRGDLQNSIGSQVVRWNLGLVGTKPNVKYAKGIEFGTRPHGVNPEVLYDWARLKLHAKDYKGVAFAVARKIKARGTKAQPYLRPALSDSKKDVVKNFNNAIENILNDIAKHG